MSGRGGDDRPSSTTSPEKDKKTHPSSLSSSSGGSSTAPVSSSSSSLSSSSGVAPNSAPMARKKLSIGYGFSSLRKRNPIKGVFEEEDKKKAKSIEVKVGNVGWRQTKHMGQEEGQQLKELVALAYQLGEGDTDDIVKLLEAWDKDKIQKEIEERQKMKMQKNKSLQILLDQWQVQKPTSTSAENETDDTCSTGKANTTESTSQLSGSNEKKVTIVTNDIVGLVNKNETKRSRITRVKSEGEVYERFRLNRRKEDNEDDTQDEYTGDSMILDDDDEELMEVPEIGSEGNESEGSDGGRSPKPNKGFHLPGRLREPRPPSMIFGKKENLDLRDWQTFIDEERSRSHSPFASPRRLSTPRNSSRNSPAGLLIFKQKKKLSQNSAATFPSSKLTLESVMQQASTAWSDEDSESQSVNTCDNEIIEPSEMSEGEGDSIPRKRANSTVEENRSSHHEGSKATPFIPKIAINTLEGEALRSSPRRHRLRQVHKESSPSAPSQEESNNNSQLSALSPSSKRERLRRISLSDSQVVFFQRWMREEPNDDVDDVEDNEIVKNDDLFIKQASYEKMDAEALRKVLLKRDNEIAELKRSIDELKRLYQNAQSRERELREKLKAEREHTERMQEREAVLKDLIREKVEEQRKSREERSQQNKEVQDIVGSGPMQVKRRETHSGVTMNNNSGATAKEKKADKKEKKSEKKDKKKGSVIKFQKESGSKERDKSNRSSQRKTTAADIGAESSAASPQVGRSATLPPEASGVPELDLLAQGKEREAKSGTWSKSRGREGKLFRHLRSKSSEEVPTALVNKEPLRDGAPT